MAFPVCLHSVKFTYKLARFPLINFNFYLAKLGTMLSSPNSPRANSSAALGNSSQRVRVFVHLTNDRVYSGFFDTLSFHGNVIPRWVLHRSPEDNIEERVYLRMPDGKGAYSIIEHLQHLINVNDDIPEQPRCWLLTLNGSLLSADLRPYNHDLLPDTSLVRCFVRIPALNSVYVGELDINRSRRPSWVM